MEIFLKDFCDLTVSELYEILRARADVFVVEQRCAYQDLDGMDYMSRHVFSMKDGRILAYLRYFRSDGGMKIGRVLTGERGKGYGKELMLKAIDDIRRADGEARITLDAQIAAVGFYEGLGFRVCSREFMEDGIPHVSMQLSSNENRNRLRKGSGRAVQASQG